MKICLISVEFFELGKYGGFGRATLIIGAILNSFALGYRYKVFKVVIYLCFPLFIP